MVLCLKARESRSLPGLQIAVVKQFSRVRFSLSIFDYGPSADMHLAGGFSVSGGFFVFGGSCLGRIAPVSLTRGGAAR